MPKISCTTVERRGGAPPQAWVCKRNSGSDHVEQIMKSAVRVVETSCTTSQVPKIDL